MIVKVCGVRSPAIAEVAVDAGADWLGVVVEPRSPRHATAAEIDAVCAAVAGRAAIIAVMVAPTLERCEILARRHRLDALQIHGDVDPDVGARMPLPVIRAFNVDAAAALTLDWWADLPILLDASPAGGVALPGGTGRRLDWTAVAEVQRHRPVLVAGGLDPDNVAAAVATIHPHGVDASSGLERNVGVKDAARVRSFVLAARRAEQAAD